jgi:hypothetical protein
MHIGPPDTRRSTQHTIHPRSLRLVGGPHDGSLYPVMKWAPLQEKEGRQKSRVDNR